MFKFRLKTVLELREMELERAEQSYRLARSRREDAEMDLQGIRQMLADSRMRPRDSFQARLDAFAYGDRLQDEGRAIETTIGVLADEESTAHAAWMEAKKEVKALEKLREKAFAEYQLDENRKEQAAIDEWATLRRAA